MRRRRSLILGATFAAIALVGAACDDDGGGDDAAEGDHNEEAECEPVGDSSTATSTVEVTLDEWVIDTDSDSAPAGSITFALDNFGEDAHELVVIQGVAPNDLPLDDHGALDEDALPAGALIGEVEPFPSGETCEGTFELAAGDYTLVCNIFDEDENEAHLDEGMVTTFTVT